MKTYIFASCRGSDFKVQGNSAAHAWNNLVDIEAENGRLWRCHEPNRVRWCLANGWKKLSFGNGMPVAYMEIDE